MTIYLTSASTGGEAASGKVGRRERQTREGQSTSEQRRDDMREQ